jgi:hypothetical protein
MQNFVDKDTSSWAPWNRFSINNIQIFRAQDIERWHRELEKTLCEVDAEAATLQESKQNGKRF